MARCRVEGCDGLECDTRAAGGGDVDPCLEGGGDGGPEYRIRGGLSVAGANDEGIAVDVYTYT